MIELSRNGMRCATLALCTMAVGSLPMMAQDTPPPPPPPQGDSARPDHPRMEHMEEHRIEHMTRVLGLTPDQVTQVKAIEKDTMTQAMALHQDASIPQADKHQKMMALHQAAEGKVRAVLTDEQKPKYDTMLAREREHMHHEGGPGAPMSPPPPPPAS